MKKLVLLFALTFVFRLAGIAQVNSYPFAATMDTFQFISGTTVDAPNEDDVYHANLPIGFNFNYNGTLIHKFGVNTNGYIILDSLNHLGPMYTPSSTASNQICAMLHDLYNSNSGGTIEYVTIGTAPNRVLVVQWKNYGVFGMQYCHLNFQIRLIEGTNCIQIYYGNNGVSGSGMAFYVGLIGNTTADYNLRNGTSNWTMCNASTTFPGTGMQLGPLSVLPNGMVYSYGICPSAGVQFSYMYGKVYNDVNNNGTQDAGELGLPNVLIHESLQNTNATTDASGNYSFFFIDSTQTYTLSCTPYTYWTVTNTPSTISIHPQVQSTANNNFGIHATPNIHDVAISCNSVNLPWPSAVVTFYATYHNIGTVVESDTILFTKDSLYTYVIATPAPAFVMGNKIGWVYSSLQLNEYRNIQLKLKADTSIQMGDTLHSNWRIQPYNVDVAQSNNIKLHNQPCLSSFDPNEKSVSPSGNINGNELLNYTIRFQNTGTAQANNIFVRDTLDSNLDINTFEITGYSHPMTYSINGTGNLLCTFANINLPDSFVNEPGSHGFVSYSIKPKVGIAQGTDIFNTASIYFDFNAPVQTNTTNNKIASLVSVNSVVSSKQAMVIFPNPANGIINVTIANTNRGKVLLQIFNSMGEMVGQQQSSSEKTKVDIHSYTAGSYLLKASTSDGRLFTQKFIKE